jgi:hypothetical protein
MKVIKEQVAMYTIILTQGEMRSLKIISSNCYDNFIEEDFCAEILDVIEDLEPVGGF